MEASQEGYQPADSQQEPTQGSGLQTPQPDQPVPTEAERQAQNTETVPEEVGGSTGSVGPSGEPAEGTVSGSGFPSNAQQEQAQVDREAELAQARQEHNDRTGGGQVSETELQEARDEHNDRTGGGVQQQADPADQPAPETDEG